MSQFVFVCTLEHEKKWTLDTETRPKSTTFCTIFSSQKLDSESKLDASTTAHVTEDGFSDADLQSNRNCEKETSKLDTRDSMVYAERTCHEIAQGTPFSFDLHRVQAYRCMDYCTANTCHCSGINEFGYNASVMFGFNLVPFPV